MELDNKQKIIKAILDAPYMPQGNKNFEEALNQMSYQAVVCFAIDAGINTDKILAEDQVSV